MKLLPWSYMIVYLPFYDNINWINYAPYPPPTKIDHHSRKFKRDIPGPQVQEQPIPDPFIISKSRILNKRVTLNVGGVRYSYTSFQQFNFFNNFQTWSVMENVGADSKFTTWSSIKGEYSFSHWIRTPLLYQN